MFPDADVVSTQLDSWPAGLKVSISCEGNELISVNQRDLFGKYGWPAEDEITEALTAFKEERK